jgi:GlcNAc-P-P-Und epimerase
MIKIIITGASGFIGTNLLEKFLNDGFEVLNIDFNEPQKHEQLRYWKNIDITNFEELHKEISSFRPNYIVHLAARTDLEGTSIEDYKANTIGVQNIINIAKDTMSLEKIIITSSMLVCDVNNFPKNQFDYSPTTIYGESKVQTEKIVWANKLSCDWAIIRPTSIWGPWFSIPYKNFFEMVLAKKYFHIGHRSCTKTYGYVGNAIFQIDKILFTETKEKSNKVFYIGDYEPLNIEDWANEIAQELEISIKRVPFFLIKTLALFGDTLNFFKIHFPMNSFRLKNMTTNNDVNLSETLKIAPNLPFSRLEGVKKTIKWLSINK